MYNLSFPSHIHIGKNSLSVVADIVTAQAYTSVFIVTDAAMVTVGHVRRLTDILHTVGVAYDIYADTVPEPTVASIIPPRDMAQNTAYDAIIAIGGGSVIDSAKAISIWARYGGEMGDYKVPTTTDKPGIPLIAIPTTGGTGSEVTKFTVITDEKTREKMLCLGRGFTPAFAVVDYTLTLTCPPRVTADSGIDALSHAVEAYVSAKANPISDMLALHAMQKIFPNLGTVYTESDNVNARENMMLGATLAGMAFNNASVALIHGMSRPIGAFFHVPHGMSNAMLFPAVTQFSAPSALRRYADCARACGITDTPDNTQASHALIDALYGIKRALQVPTLQQFGADKRLFFDNLDTMADQALASGSPQNNPITPTKQQIIELYKQVWYEG